nr:RibD C-terminal domain protein [uncultured bacterium]
MRIYAVAALTVDGFIGRYSGHFADWTGEEDKKVFVRLTKEAGTMVMGSNTFATIGRALPERRNIVMTSKPDKIKVEGVEATNETPEALVKRLEKEGVETLAVLGGAGIYTAFMQAGLMDELYITYVPVVFGGGITMFKGELDAKLEMREQTTLPDGSILVRYIVKKS